MKLEDMTEEQVATKAVENIEFYLMDSDTRSLPVGQLLETIFQRASLGRRHVWYLRNLREGRRVHLEDVEVLMIESGRRNCE